MKNRSWLIIPLCILCSYFFILSRFQANTIEDLESMVETLKESNQKLESDIESLEYELKSSYDSGYEDASYDFPDHYDKGYENGIYEGYEIGYDDGYKDGENSWNTDPYIPELLYEHFWNGFEAGYATSGSIYIIPRFNKNLDLTDYIEDSWERIYGE